jgi:hypothetical protein
MKFDLETWFGLLAPVSNRHNGTAVPSVPAPLRFVLKNAQGLAILHGAPG